MSNVSMIVAVLGLSLFETVSSADNAIINAEVLAGMSRRARRWFLVWGILFAVFIVWGLLPWVIVGQHRPHQEAAPPEERGDVLHPGAGRRHDG